MLTVIESVESHKLYSKQLVVIRLCLQKDLPSFTCTPAQLSAVE